MKTKALVVAVAALACLAVATPAKATIITYGYTTLSGDSGPGGGITYTLAINDVNGATTFTIAGTASSSELWTGGWFNFKFDGSNPVSISSLTPPASTGPWSIANSQVQVLGGGGNYNNLLPGGATGFYVTSLRQGNTAVPSQGVCLAGSCTPNLPAVFTFTLGLPANWDDTSIPFQVGYYDSLTGSGHYQVNQLSRTFGIPDGGATLVLLGGALLGLGVLRRKLGA